MSAGGSGRVVVLGARGFVARDLVAHLGAAGAPVVPIGSTEIDLTDRASVDALAARLAPDDALVVTSALTPDRGKDARTLMKNLAMGEHVAAAIEKKGCAHVIYVGSDAVYADDVALVRTSTPAAPASFHGVMHLAREQMIAAAAAKSKTPLLLLRPTLLYGPGDTHDGYGPNRFVRLALAGETIALFGEGEEKRDHLHVRDLSRLVEACLQARARGVLDAATGVSTSFRGVADAIAARVPGTKIAPSVRAPGAAILHRHFDVAALRERFPSLRFRALAAGLAETVAARRS